MRCDGPHCADRAGGIVRGSGIPSFSSWSGRDGGKRIEMRAAFLIFVSALTVFAQATSQVSSPQTVMQLSMKKAVEIALTPEGSPRVALALESVKQIERELGVD